MAALSVDVIDLTSSDEDDDNAAEKLQGLHLHSNGTSQDGSRAATPLSTTRANSASLQDSALLTPPANGRESAQHRPEKNFAQGESSWLRCAAEMPSASYSTIIDRANRQKADTLEADLNEVTDTPRRRRLSPIPLRERHADPQESTTSLIRLQAIPHKSFSSFEVKSLSQARLAKTRLPDLVQHDQNNGRVDSTHVGIFIGYVQEHEEGHADLQVVNDIDEEPIPPMDFAYTDGYEVSEGIGPATRRVDDMLKIPAGCDCTSEECDPRTCQCQKLHPSLAPNPWWFRTAEQLDDATEEQTDKYIESEMRYKFAYDHERRLHRHLVDIGGAPIWECNSACGCSERCKNRSIQFGRSVALVLKKTVDSGWGVFAGQDMAPGTFVTTYAGQLISAEMADQRGKVYTETYTTYCIDNDHYHITFHYAVPKFRAACRDDSSLIPNHIPKEYFDKSKDGELVRMYLDPLGYDIVEHARRWSNMDDVTYTIDAGLWGNLARFVNHSCAPNLSTFPVYTEERDLRRPFLALFTNQAVTKGEQLCFDYRQGETAEEAAEAMAAGDPHQNDSENNSQASAQSGSQLLRALDEVMEAVAPGTIVRIDDANTLAKATKSGGKDKTGAAATQEKRYGSLHTMKCRCGAKNCRGYIFN